MEAYKSLASVYDMLMDNISYETWAGYLCGLLEDFGIRGGLVLELGCGTGSLTELLARRGYDMIGVDISTGMLQSAIEKKEKSGLDILYLLQDMREFELYGTVAAVVSACDSVNYLTSYEDLVKTLGLVNNYLDPGGVFIFDINTPYKYQEIMGETTIAESREECCFIWENFFDKETRINEYELTLFLHEEGELYRRFDETHFQRAYELAEVKAAAAEAGMEWVAVYDAFTRETPKKDSQRVHVIVREHGKKKGENRL